MGIDGEWHYGLLAKTYNRALCREVGWFISNKVGSPFAYHIRPETLGQYTGLKDKAGKKIYKGDIMIIGRGKKKEVGEIYWKNGCGFMWKSKKREFSFLHLLELCSQDYTKNILSWCEISGNIHNDMKLLEVNNE